MTAENHTTDPQWAAADEAACDSDRAWFKDHPERRYRLRLAAPGEAGVWERDGGVVAVRAIAPKVRVRLRVPVPGAILTKEPEEPTARQAFDEFADDLGVTEKLAALVRGSPPEFEVYDQTEGGAS